jgi:hypothetical protein
MIENKIHLSNSTLDDRFDNKMVPESQKKWKFEKKGRGSFIDFFLKTNNDQNSRKNVRFELKVFFRNKRKFLI